MQSKITKLPISNTAANLRNKTNAAIEFRGGGERHRGGHAKQLAILGAMAVLVVWLAGCSSSAQSKPPGPVQVSVAEVACRQFGETDEFTGRLEAVNTVEVRPRVSGYLQSVHFKEGAVVRQGTLLFQIDPRPFQAEVDRLKGELAQARAELSRTQSDFQRAYQHAPISEKARQTAAPGRAATGAIGA